jgi:arginase
VDRRRLPNIADWGISAFSPDDLRSSSAALVDWIESTGCSRVAVHLDVDTVDSDEVVLGLGAEPGGLTSEQVRRLVSDIDTTADVVGFTIAEYVPRQVIALQRLVWGLPLL